GIIGKELPGKMGNDGAGFPQFKAGMQETRHLAQLRVENAALLYLLDHHCPCRCFLSHFSPPTDQENHQHETHVKDCNDDVVNVVRLILLQCQVQPVSCIENDPCHENNQCDNGEPRDL